MSKTFEIRIPADSEGFVIFNCSLCNDRFKLDAGEAQADDVLHLFCPSCGMKGEMSDFYPPEVFEAANRLVENEVARMINDFGKNLERKFQSSKHIKVKRGRELPLQAEKVLSVEEGFERVDLPCCGKATKVSLNRMDGMGYCPYCGVHRS